MKKFFITMLSSLMLISCLGFNTYADDVKLTAAEPEDVPLEYANKVANIAINFAWAFSGGGKLLFGSCLSGGIVGIVDIAMDLIGQVICFGPSEEEMQRQELMDKLNSIDASIGDVNAKVDSLADQINESIKMIDSKLDNISIKLDKDNISNVANIANYLRNEMDNFDSVLNSQIHTWYENKNLNNYLTIGKFVLSVPNGQTSSTLDPDKNLNNLDVIYIDADLMSSIINSYIQEQLTKYHNDGWDADKKDDIVKEIFRRIILSDDFDKTQGTEFDSWIKKVYPGYTDWQTFNNKQEAIETLAEAGYGTLCEIATRNIAKSSNGSDTYVKTLIEKFSAYCNYLSETNGEYTSPLASYANIYSSIYAFQGDLKRSVELDEYDEQGEKTGKKITENTNLLKMSMEKYISELNQLGTFVGIMAKASGNYGEETDMRKLVYIPWAAAEDHLQKDYEKYYHVKNGNEVDNYCYITNTVLAYFSGALRSDLVMKFYAWENGFGTDIKSYRDTYMATDFNYDYSNDMMVDTASMNLIYAHYANTNGNVSFTEYLEKNKTGIEEFYDDNLPSTIITRFIGGRDFTSDDNVKMFVKNCHNNPDKWEGKDYTKGDTATVTSSSSHFKVRRKATADVFDLNTGVATLGKRIGAVASFYEKYTFKDDLVVFWDAEYNNPQSKDELIKLAALDKDRGVYWRERYDTKSDDEERYRSHVEYYRPYGTLLSYSLDNSSAPIPQNVKCFGAVQSYRIKDDAITELDKALKKAGISKQEYNDFIYDDTYMIYFDETKYDGEINEELYTKLIEYCNDETNIDNMTNDYYDINDQINEMVDNIKDKLVVSDDVQELAKELIKNDLDCYIVDEIPNYDLGKNVYDYTSGKLYIWDENKYVAYNSKDSVAEKVEPSLSADEDDVVLESPQYDSEEFVSKFTTKLTDVGDYPCTDSTDLKLEYQIKTVLAYELYFDGEDIEYRIHPIYDVTPILKWNDSGDIKQKEISDKELDAVNIDSIEILLPVLKLDNKKDNYAIVNHYCDIKQMENPIESFTPRVKIINDYKYCELKAKTFSPYVVSKTYYEKPQDYKIPKTGIR